MTGENRSARGDAPTNQGLIPGINGKPLSFEEAAQAVAGWLRVLVDPQDVVELRALKCRTRDNRRPHTCAGFYDYAHLYDMAWRAMVLSRGESPGIYFTLNPVHRDLLSRRCNRTDMAESGTLATDANIIRRRWILIDADPIRIADVSSTDHEKAAARELVERVRTYLREIGWPEPILADSGNGYHLLYRIDLPVDDGGLVERCLKALAAQFDSVEVKIDTTVFNPSRIVKLYGTVSRKGDNTPDRPHRRSRVIDIPDERSPVPIELLEALAATAPKPVVAPKRTSASNVSSLTAVNAATGNQTTTYLYGTTLTTSAIASSLLKVAEVYPEAIDEGDRKTLTYNRQSDVTTLTDQNGTVHSYEYDKFGRLTQDRVTTLGTGVDGAVRRIGTTYEVRGLVEKITSYDNATVGSGTIVNEVQRGYNAFGQLTVEYQSHGGAVNTMTTPQVQYGYADGSANTIRPTSLTYPNGRILTYAYGTANGNNDAASRIESLIDDDTTHLADYVYLGLSRFVEADYTEPDVKYTLVNLSGGNDPDTGDIYSGFDRFGRVKDLRWRNYNASIDVVRIKHGYDRAGNRLYREDLVAASFSKAFDELYKYDGLYRLKDMVRGTLNGSKSAITNPTFAQCWGLDATGNWSDFRQDDDGDTVWNLIQSRTTNKVNEITDISESIGPSWVTPSYDSNGNTTTVPQPAAPTNAFTCVYDGWNRLTKIRDTLTANALAEYEFDGTARRIATEEYVSGVLSEARHFYLTNSPTWQVIEEHAGSNPVTTTISQQFIWGLRYADDVICRDRNTAPGDSLDERLYGMQDSNWNTVALISVNSTIEERHSYEAYGRPLFLTASFNSRTESFFDWRSLYAGYRFDTDTGLYHVRNRILGPTTAWLQRDAFFLAAGKHLYEYVSSMPITLVDPYGLWPNAGCSCSAEPYCQSSQRCPPITQCSEQGQPITVNKPIAPPPSGRGNPPLTTCEEICAYAAQNLFPPKAVNGKPSVVMGSIVCGPKGEMLCGCLIRYPADLAVKPGNCPDLDACVLSHERGHLAGRVAAIDGRGIGNVDLNDLGCDPKNPKPHSAKFPAAEVVNYHKAQFDRDVQCFARIANDTRQKGYCRNAARMLIDKIRARGTSGDFM